MDLLFDAPLLAAELHYFRTARDDWEQALLRLRQLGASVVASDVPWSWHAPTPALCDLTGASHPLRDLVGFVAICGRLGLRVILRPGPFVAGESLSAGVPAWLLQQHPEIHALRPDGQPWLHTSGLPHACAAHPVFEAHARNWFAAFSAAIGSLQWPAGPIIALQIDNDTLNDAISAADLRFRADYNQHMRQVVWPAWLRTHYNTLTALNSAWGRAFDAFEQVPLPNEWHAATSVADLRRYSDLNRFNDYSASNTLAEYAGWLRAQGWQIALFHNVRAVPWEGAGVLADASGYAAASGWLAHTVQAPFVAHANQRYSFEEYIHFAHWRTRLARSLSPHYPAFSAQISAAQDFFFAAPFVGGLDGLCVAAAQQTPLWAASGERLRAWNARLPLTLLDATTDFARSRAPADLAIGYSHVPEHLAIWLRQPGTEPPFAAAQPAIPGLEQFMAGCDQAVLGQQIAQQLVRASVSFDVVDLDAIPLVELQRYRLVAMPGSAMLARATQQKLAELERLALVGEALPRYDEQLEPCALLTEEQLLRLPANLAGEALGTLVEELGGVARYAWADSADVDVLVRHGTAAGAASYLCVANRKPVAYGGTLAYRELDGSIEHLHISLGPRRVALLVVARGEVLGAAIGGDASEGGWVARGLRTGMVWNNGAGVVAPYMADDVSGDSTDPLALLCAAPSSGRFDLRRPAGWQEVATYRLLRSGEALAAPHSQENTHLVLPYVAEDELGATDCYLVLNDASELPKRLRSYFATLLAAQAAMLERAADTLVEAEATTLRATAQALTALQAQLPTLEQYRSGRAAAWAALVPVLEQLERKLTTLRAARASTQVVQPDEQERALEQALLLAARLLYA